MRGPEIHGRLPLPERGRGGACVYRHAAEHRGYGIVAIYSYGPARKHPEIVREAAHLMRWHFGVDHATSSGGISDWPKDEFSGAADYNDRTLETQTIFSIDAHGGPNRRPTRKTAPAKADWHLKYLVDLDTGYAADGDMDVYLTGPLLDREEWEGLVTEWTEGAPVREARVRALSQGRYWFLSGGDPVAEWGEKS